MTPFRLIVSTALFSALWGCSSTANNTATDASVEVVGNDMLVTPGDVRDASPTDLRPPDVTLDTGVMDVLRPDVPDVPNVPDVPDVPEVDVGAELATTDVSQADAVADRSGDAPSAVDGCARPEIMVLSSRIACGFRADGGLCPTGYECLASSGAVLQEFCGRSCRADCDCPAPQICGSYTDKAGRHSLCVNRAD